MNTKLTKKVVFKDKDVPAKKAKEIKGGIIAVLKAAPGTAQSHGTGGGAGKVNVQDMSFTH